MAGVSSYAVVAATGRPRVVQFGRSSPRGVSRTRLRHQNAAGGGRFGLDSNSELQVAVKPSTTSGSSKVEIELVATNTRSNLALHWGALQPGRKEWVVPPRLPEGTVRMQDDAALRTPFKTSGSNSTLKIEIDDPGLEAIEFVLVDEAQNKWFMNNGGNFQEKHGHQVLSKKVFKLGEKEILALLSQVQGGSIKVHVATNHADSLILHWALAKKAGEWLAPPPGIVPAGSTLLEMACETSFSDAELDGLHYQVLEIELDEDSYKGMPFVLRSNQTWMKNGTSDFYLDFSRRTPKSSEDTSDASKKTAKALLETIADLEEDAQRSLMHRFNIAADLVEQAKDAGQLGLAGLLVWVRFMATRQLIWNKNYNVKPRYVTVFSSFRRPYLNSWQIISPVDVAGYVVVVDQLLTDGVVAVLTPDMPDVLSHVSVRARNSKVLFATCFDPNILSELEQNEGKVLSLKPASVDISYREIPESELLASSSPDTPDGAPSLSLVKKQFVGKYAISAEEFSDEMVGAKSRNIAYLNGKVPSWVSVPTSVALPFGTFETVLSDKINKEVAQELNILMDKLNQGELGALNEIRNTVLNLTAPTCLVNDLKEKMQGSGMPWPGDEGEQRWEQAWTAIKKVWASKWNERAYLSTRKVKLDHANLSMSVLVQQVVSADYAFVIHTTNPSSGESSEIYAEVVKGLGETLVGAFPCRAMSFVCNKDNLDSPKVLGYPSKPIGLFIKKSIIFRSDSNGEDLEGYAGAGLYDSVPMDKEEEVVLDYTSDKLVTDCNFQKSILSSIARAGYEIEQLYGGSPQDIEGVVKDGKIYVVQTRPQM